MTTTEEAPSCSKIRNKIVSSLLFWGSSSCMLLANRVVAKVLPYPHFVMIYQNLASVLLLLFMQLRFLFLEQLSLTELFAGLSTKVLFWLPVTFLFVVNIVTSFESLRYITVPAFTVFRNLTSCVTELVSIIRPVDASRLSFLGWMALLIIIAGSVMYGWNDLLFSLKGYLWALLHVFSMAFYAVAVKYMKSQDVVVVQAAYLPLNNDGNTTGADVGENSQDTTPYVRHRPLNSTEMSFLNNLLSLPLLLMTFYIQADYSIGSAISSFEFLWATRNVAIVFLLSSPIFALLLSISAFWVQAEFSPTTMITMNNVNKLPLVVVNNLMLAERLSPNMEIGLIVSIAGAILYGFETSGTWKQISFRIKSFFSLSTLLIIFFIKSADVLSIQSYPVIGTIALAQMNSSSLVGKSSLISNHSMSTFAQLDCNFSQSFDCRTTCDLNPEASINGWLAGEPLAANVSKEAGFLHSLWSHPLECELANGDVTNTSAFVKEVREDFQKAGGLNGENLFLFDDFAMQQLAERWSEFQFPRFYNSNSSFWLTVSGIVNHIRNQFSISAQSSRLIRMAFDGDTNRMSHTLFGALLAHMDIMYYKSFIFDRAPIVGQETFFASSVSCKCWSGSFRDWEGKLTAPVYDDRSCKFSHTHVCYGDQTLPPRVSSHNWTLDEIHTALYSIIFSPRPWVIADARGYMMKNGLFPYKYVAVHIRTGDKIFGYAAEGVFIPWSRYLNRAIYEAKRFNVSMIYLATDVGLVRDFATRGYPTQIYGITWILEEENGNFDPAAPPYSESENQRSFHWGIRNTEIFANAAMFVTATHSAYAMPAYALRGADFSLNTIDYHQNVIYPHWPGGPAPKF